MNTQIAGIPLVLFADEIGQMEQPFYRELLYNRCVLHVGA
jgi:hypothetical protein